MPNIIEYNGPQNPELHPSDIGERSLYNEARVTHQMGEEQAQKIKTGFAGLAAAAEGVVKQYQHTDVTNTLSAFATTNNQLHDAAQAYLKNPNLDISDPALAENFMQTQYDPAMQKIKDNIKTQDGMDEFNRHYNEFSTQFRQQLHHDVSTMAGIHADAAITNYVNQQSQLIEKNPSALEPTMRTWDSTVKSIISSSPNITPEDVEKLQDKFATAGKVKFQETALGKIMMSDPNQAQKLLDSGAFPDIDGMKANTAIKQMQTMARQNAASDRAMQRFAEEERNDRVMGQTVSQIGQLAKAAQGGDTSAMDKLKQMSTQVLIDGPKNGMKGQTAYQAHEMINNTMAKLSTKADVVTDASTLSAIHDKMLDPSGPQVTASDIIKENLQGKLSDADTHEAVGLLNLMKTDPSTQNYMQQFGEKTAEFESLIKGANPMQADVPGLGGYRYSEFKTEHLKQFQQGLTAGIPAQDMLTPGNKNYIFNDLKDFLVTPEQEQTIFGKPFTLENGPGSGATPISVRIMEAWRAQAQAAKDRQDKMNAITGIRTGPPPAPAMPNPNVGGGL